MLGGGGGMRLPRLLGLDGVLIGGESYPRMKNHGSATITAQFRDAMGYGVSHGIASWCWGGRDDSPIL